MKTILEDGEPTGRFWLIETREEDGVVKRLLLRRYPVLFRALSEVLESTDPMDVVYPNNPDEYSDVVREMLVIIAGSGEVGRLPAHEIAVILRRAIGLCFGEDPDPARLERAALLLSAISLDQ